MGSVDSPCAKLSLGKPSRSEMASIRSKRFYFALLIVSIWAASSMEVGTPETELTAAADPSFTELGASIKTGSVTNMVQTSEASRDVSQAGYGRRRRNKKKRTFKTGRFNTLKNKALALLKKKKKLLVGKVNKKIGGLMKGRKKVRGKKLGLKAKKGKAKPLPGVFPSKHLKAKADEIARKFLAKNKIIADKKNKKVKKKLKRVAKLIKVRKKAYKAKLKAKKFLNTADIDEDHIINSKEREGKAIKELDIAKAHVKKLRDMPGVDAKRDKKAAQVLLSKIRIAKAHADHTIVGLTPEQKKNPAYLALHQAIVVAAGDPTDHNLQNAERQIKVTQVAVVKEKKYKIWKAKDVVAKEKAKKVKAERKKKELKAKKIEKAK